MWDVSSEAARLAFFAALGIGERNPATFVSVRPVATINRSLDCCAIGYTNKSPRL